MSLVRFSQTPWFDRFFDNGELMDWSNKNYSKTNTTLPSVNVKENENEYQIEVAVPGFDKKDFKIEVHNDVLSISSEKKENSEEKDENGRYTKREFSYQSFCRSFTLPHTVDGEKIEANYDKGILNVVIPKREEAKPKAPRTVEIK
ncbi:Heat shock protein Hsp20 [uncultured Paludibacter sp.]|uniref:Heat shock protein Hsp20 n=1 Tax=uncultured Paludibacter sp. TaxID=497635 RepID=A0A653AFW6_9BACT|nr:Heat shock protein Hsp20 [uncultured Paludibacter sp.]